MNVLYIKGCLAFLISYITTFYLIPLIAAYAIRIGFIDRPDGKMKTHENPTPYLGGIAVYLGFLAAFIVTFPVEHYVSLLLIGITLLLCVGLVDDAVTLKPHQKLIGQILATICFLRAGFHLKEQFFNNIWNIPLSFLWILSVVNAFNLVDIMDGLATTLAIGCAGSFLVLALYFNLSVVVLLLASLLGALVAFLYYNKPPAQMYLGDAGSLFIGGFLATVPFLFNWGLYNAYGYVAPIVILAIPLLEVTTLIVIRSYKKIPFYNGSPDHFAIYLMKNGWAKQTILYYVATLSCILGVVAFLFVVNGIMLPGLLASGVLFLTGWSMTLMAKVEIKQR